MNLPEEFTPVWVEPQQVPIDRVFELSSQDKTGGEIYDATYKITENFQANNITVSFDSIEFWNDQYSVTVDDYISFDGVKVPVPYNATFYQVSEVASFFDIFFELSGVTYEWDERNTWTIQLSLSTANTVMIMSYRVARLLGFWDKDLVINDDKDIQFTPYYSIVKPVKRQIEKYRWAINFGQLVYNATTNYSKVIMSEGNFGGPNSPNTISGQELTDATVYNWRIKLFDDQDIYHKILTDYIVRYRVVRNIPGHWTKPSIPKAWRNLFSKTPKPAKLTKNFRQEVKATAPHLLPRAQQLSRLAELKENNKYYKGLIKTIHPSYQKIQEEYGEQVRFNRKFIERMLTDIDDLETIDDKGTTTESTMTSTIAKEVGTQIDDLERVDKSVQKAQKRIEKLTQTVENAPVTFEKGMQVMDPEIEKMEARILDLQRIVDNGDSRIKQLQEGEKALSIRMRDFVDDAVQTASLRDLQRKAKPFVHKYLIDDLNRHGQRGNKSGTKARIANTFPAITSFIVKQSDPQLLYDLINKQNVELGYSGGIIMRAGRNVMPFNILQYDDFKTPADADIKAVWKKLVGGRESMEEAEKQRVLGETMRVVYDVNHDVIDKALDSGVKPWEILDPDNVQGYVTGKLIDPLDRPEDLTIEPPSEIGDEDLLAGGDEEIDDDVPEEPMKK